MNQEQQPSLVCAICGFRHDSAPAARACEAQGRQENAFQVGDTFELPYAGGVTVQVIELIAASMLDHLPGILYVAVAGNTEKFIADFTSTPQFFDQGTALRYTRDQKNLPQE